jgi:hypothetical protein
MKGKTVELNDKTHLNFDLLLFDLRYLWKIFNIFRQITEWTFQTNFQKKKKKKKS